ncbi:hypothetical protein E0K89_000480 [Aquicoccus sp. SCR17]|nr:hypothetical protein [Carideicomes alvinocaridis]
MLDAATDAFFQIAQFHRLLFLVGGVVLGLVIGILPGVGGLAGMALLLPFTFQLDPISAFAFLLGLAAVTSTGDTIPAVVFGVPGTQASQATVLDGHAMAKKGEAGRALSAAYVSSMIGGVVGAFFLALSIPVLRPVMLYIGSPELLACAVFGISLVSILSGNSALKGLAAAGFGIMLSMIGADPQTGDMRWTLGSIYLYDGLPLMPVALGLFALPELCDFAIQRVAISRADPQSTRKGMAQGARDALRNIRLVMQCASLGTVVGSIPGLGTAVVDWFAYGFAARTIKGARETFGRGDVRGVIAPESANNATTSGALIPTVAFGVPGSASMAILLGAFLIHGLVPGPQMLTSNLDVTYSMIWSIALANIFGAGICFALSGQLAKLATLRYTLIMPTVLSIVYLGAFQGNRDWGDLYALLAFGVLGWVMKCLRWPRPPMMLGFVLGAIIERYMFISTMRYSWEWLLRPVVLVVLVGAAIIILQPIVAAFLRRRRTVGPAQSYSPGLRLTDLFAGLMIVLVGVMVSMATSFQDGARLGPMIVGCFTFVALILVLADQVMHRLPKDTELSVENAEEALKGHMDLVSSHDGLSPGTVVLRGAIFFGWMLGFMALMALIGLIPTAFVFIIAYMRLENREPWKLVLPIALGATLFIFVVFHVLLAIPWPPTLLGTLLPWAKAFPSV